MAVPKRKKSKSKRDKRRTHQKLTAVNTATCPECGEAALRKKISAVAFRLKGSGWYETDFKTGDKKNLAGGSEKGGRQEGGTGQEVRQQEGMRRQAESGSCQEGRSRQEVRSC